MSFRQALLLANAIDGGDPSFYEARHPSILRLAHVMSNVMLRMDRSPSFRGRAMAAFVGEPGLFGRILAAHVGELPFSKLLLKDGLRLGWRLLLPRAEPAS